MVPCASPSPPPRRIDTLLLGCTHYPLLAAAIRAVGGDRVAVVDSATATAWALGDLLAINGLEAPGSSRGTAADPGRDGHARPAPAAGPVVHRQLTTGSTETFSHLPGGCSGMPSPTSRRIELGVPVG